jgi:hypothetical protein
MPAARFGWGLIARPFGINPSEELRRRRYEHLAAGKGPQLYKRFQFFSRRARLGANPLNRGKKSSGIRIANRFVAHRINSDTQAIAIGAEIVAQFM